MVLIVMNGVNLDLCRSLLLSVFVSSGGIFIGASPEVLTYGGEPIGTQSDEE